MPSKSRHWSQQQDKLLMQFMKPRSDQSISLKLTWNEIAEQLKSKFEQSHRKSQGENQRAIKFIKTGKQCRQRYQLTSYHRWMNHLHEGLKKNVKWTVEQNCILFESHNQFGNKWSYIANRLPGRTDNCVKNHFYSVLRRGMRKINQYIETIKRKESLVKTFKNQMLNKILLLSESEGKYDQKFHFNSKAKQLALEIKSILISLSGEQLSQTIVKEQNKQQKMDEQNMMSDQEENNSKQNIELQEKGYEMICQFAKNCKKRKSKKCMESDLQSDQPSISRIQSKQTKKSELKKKKQIAQSFSEQIDQNEHYSFSPIMQAKKQDFYQEPKNLYEGKNIHSPSSIQMVRQQSNWSSKSQQQFNNSSVKKQEPLKNPSKVRSQTSLDVSLGQQKSKKLKTRKNNAKKQQDQKISTKDFVGEILDQLPEVADKIKQNEKIQERNKQSTCSINQRQKHQVRILKASSFQHDFMDRNAEGKQLLNVFITNGVNFNQSGGVPTNEGWFNRSGVEGEKNFLKFIGDASIHGDNSYSQLIGSTMRKQNEDMEDNMMARGIDSEIINFFYKSSSNSGGSKKININQSQQYFPNDDSLNLNKQSNYHLPNSQIQNHHQLQLSPGFGCMTFTNEENGRAKMTNKQFLEERINTFMQNKQQENDKNRQRERQQDLQ